MGEVTNAVLPVAGVVLGAFLQYWFSRTADRDRHVENLRAEAYADYLRAVAASAYLRSDEDLVAALRSAANAKTRIVVYGSSKVVSALARFEKVGASLGSDTSVTVFISLVSAMRASSAAVSEQDIRLVLMGTAQQIAPADRVKTRSG